MTRSFLSTSLLILAFGTGIVNGQVNITGLRSDDWQIRAATLRRIIANPSLLSSQSTEDELIQCLEREDQILTGRVIVQPSPFEDETYSDNYLSLLESTVFDIAKTNGNQRAYDALISSAYNPASEIGQAIASRISNLPSLLSLASSVGSGQRLNAAAGVANLLLLSKQPMNMPISAEQYRDAKTMLRKLITNERDAPVREVATKGLAGLLDREDIPLLQKVANEDVASYKGTDGLNHYPVREAAAAGLHRIAASQSSPLNLIH